MNAETILKIEAANLFLSIQSEGFEGSEGEEMLRFAMELGKPILIYYSPERLHLPLPKALKGYADYAVFVGAPEELAAAVVQYYEPVPGKTELSVSTQSWDPKL